MAFVIKIDRAPSLHALPDRSLLFYLEGKAGLPAAEVHRADALSKVESKLGGSGIGFERMESFAGDRPRYFTFAPAGASAAGFAIVGNRFVLIVSFVSVSEAVDIVEWNESAAWVTAIGSSNDSDRREIAHAVQPLKLRLASNWHDTSEPDACALARSLLSPEASTGRSEDAPADDFRSVDDVFAFFRPLNVRWSTHVSLSHEGKHLRLEGCSVLDDRKSGLSYESACLLGIGPSAIVSFRYAADLE